ncbi:N-acetylneuraminate synthase [Paraneptunicella aestuarii]|uniref:N-acetylneuraminate synthase n=1 Tax=Paraneptunicella aestuarii TaxID=2831148 RepID=UPI001E593894|nr:N-acetylneuraminate synthase [Paraneptunicella aestuarii]UAA39150.1 N-acetylneuraminate synthase [Paraneptunicella aestuarii]
MSTFIIAEAGVNHNGELDKALRLVDVAVEAGADAVKFQTFKAESLATDKAGKAEYQKKLTDSEESQVAMLKKLELPHEYHFKLKAYCEEKNIEFMSTAFDFGSLQFLLAEMDLKRLKIPSGEITNLPLIYEHAKSGLDIILSTGMATVGEIEQALMVIAGGYLDNLGRNIQQNWKTAYFDEGARTLLKSKVSLLHCVSQYPAPAESLNLTAIKRLRKTFGLNAGYSDHSLGIWAPISAVTMDATIIEKHFTLDRNLPGPDHQASLEPHELKQMVEAIRNVEAAIGDGVKRPVASELVNLEPVRKSLVLAKPIRRGEVITEQHLAIMRPGTGMPPSKYWDMIGATVSQDYEAGDFLCE